MEIPKNKKVEAYKGKITCHWVANTHWDREWQYSHQRSRFRLVELMDKLLEILERNSDYKSFHLDSQTMPVQDYLEIRPEKRSVLEKHVKSRRLVVGPWFTLPDESSVSGESLVRNLLLGHKIAKELGHVPKIGYSPFGWGQVSQMPQIYRGFGIDSAAFYRGINTDIAPRSEFYWEGPDGSRLLASRLGTRMRYNAWFNMQRAVLFNWKDVDNKDSTFSHGGAPVRFADMEKFDTFYAYAHPEYKYYKDRVGPQVDRMIRDQDEDWTTPHRFWANGHDVCYMDYRESDLVKDANEAMGDRGDVIFSTYEDFQKGVKDHARNDLPVVKGEMRYHPKVGDQFGYMGSHNITSARVYLKQEHYRTEREITKYAEPAGLFASFIGQPYPQAFIDHAYNWLLQNHGHDTIGACSRDAIHRDMQYRLRQTREISRAVIEQSLRRIAGAVKLEGMSREDMALVVYNPAPFSRGYVSEMKLDIPKEWNAPDFAIYDENGSKVPMEILEKEDFDAAVVQHPTDVQISIDVDRYHVLADFSELPSMGYKTFTIKALPDKRFHKVQSLVTGPRTMENDNIRVAINSNGSLKIYDKLNQRTFDRVGYFKDRSAALGPHDNDPALHDKIFTTLEQNAEITLVEDHELRASFEVRMDWNLPEGLTADRKRRSEILKTCKITNTVTLKKSSRSVEVETIFDNTVKDHYLKLCYSTQMKTDKVKASVPFDVVERSIEIPELEDYSEPVNREQPMKSFLDINDSQSGFAFMGDGLAGYEAHEDKDRTIEIALLRGLTLQSGWSALIHYPEDRDTQSIGMNRFRYAFMPHKGDYQEGDVWRAVSDFNLIVHPVQIGGHDKGTESREKSFLELTNETVSVEALKMSEDGQGYVVRLLNPFSKKLSGKIRLNGGKAPAKPKDSIVDFYADEFTLPGTSSEPWQNVEAVTLEEKPEKDLKIDSSGWVSFEMSAKKILTIKFS